MAIRIVEIHAAESPEALNDEWFILENEGENPFSTRNCTLSVTRKSKSKSKKKGKNKRTRIELGTLDPGFVLAPGDKVRVITGNPGKKAHGKQLDDDTSNYSLFLGAAVLRGPGTVLIFGLRSLEVARAEFDPEAASGVAAKG